MAQRTFIKKYSSSIVDGMIQKVNEISSLTHKLTKGQLRELFVANILNLFLTSQFDVGSGIVINKNGAQSNQTDIIISDNRILPPFLREQQIGVYPAESVIATIEIKSILEKRSINGAQTSAKKLHTVVFSPEEILYNDVGECEKLNPLCAVFGFSGAGVRELTQENLGRKWLRSNIENLIAICLANKYSWMKVQGNWAIRKYDRSTHEEIKRFMAVLIDNIRTVSERRFAAMSLHHRDWLGEYIRDYGA